MKMLSDDDLDLKDMSDEELDAAWDLWFDLAQSTNDADPPYTHGVFVNLGWEDDAPPAVEDSERTPDRHARSRPPAAASDSVIEPSEAYSEDGVRAPAHG